LEGADEEAGEVRGRRMVGADEGAGEVRWRKHYHQNDQWDSICLY
jgi:hypothetical protein